MDNQINRNIGIDDFLELIADDAINVSEYACGLIMDWYNKDETNDQDNEEIDCEDGWYEETRDLFEGLARIVAKRLGFPLSDMNPSIQTDIEKKVKIRTSELKETNMPYTEFLELIKDDTDRFSKNLLEDIMAWTNNEKVKEKWADDINDLCLVMSRFVARKLGFPLNDMKRKSRHYLELNEGELPEGQLKLDVFIDAGKPLPQATIWLCLNCKKRFKNPTLEYWPPTTKHKTERQRVIINKIEMLVSCPFCDNYNVVKGD